MLDELRRKGYINSGQFCAFSSSMHSVADKLL
jgi:hypothetical protein